MSRGEASVVMPRLTTSAHTQLAPVPEEAGRDHVAKSPTVTQYPWRGSWVIAAHGDFDLHSVQPLADALQLAVGRHPRVVLDASGITFADSTLLNLLVYTHQTGDLRVAAPSPQVRNLCEITAVDTLLQIHPTIDAAVS
jgi:anti-anti-sigma factor